MVTRTPVDFFTLAIKEYDYLQAAIDTIDGQRFQNRSWAIAAAGVLFTVSFSACPQREQSLQVTADRTVVSATRARSAHCFSAQMASGQAFLSGCSVPYADRAEKTADAHVGRMANWARTWYECVHGGLRRSGARHRGAARADIRRGPTGVPDVLGPPAAAGRRCWQGLSEPVVARRFHDRRDHLPVGRAIHDGREGCPVRRHRHGQADPSGAHPGAAKRLGRQVREFDEQTWAARRFQVVVTGNLAKFSQDPALGGFLLATVGKVLVEAAPNDRIWGIGLAAADERAMSPEQWPGLNLLGFALMEVRCQLAAGRASALPKCG